MSRNTGSFLGASDGPADVRRAQTRATLVAPVVASVDAVPQRIFGRRECAKAAGPGALPRQPSSTW